MSFFELGADFADAVDEFRFFFPTGFESGEAFGGVRLLRGDALETFGVIAADGLLAFEDARLDG